jgi:ABC-type branched-subunit amino acid transport system substrate-binding protein
MQARVDQVNATGGIHGHQIQLIICDDQQNENDAIACAREAVADHVVAALAPTSSAGLDEYTLPIFQKAGIPLIDNPAVSTEDWTSPVAFPLDVGTQGQYDGVALAIKAAGCKKVGALTLPVPAGAQSEEDVNTAVTALGLPPVDNIAVGFTEPTYTSQVAQLTSDGVDCIVPIILPTEGLKLIAAAQQSGTKFQFAGVTAAFSQSMLTSLGSAAQGILLAGDAYLPTDTSVLAVRQMLSAIKKYQPLIPVNDIYSTDAWAGANLLVNRLDAIKGKIDAATLIKSLKLSKNVPTGASAPYTYVGKAPLAGFPRIRNVYDLTWTVNAKGVPVLTSHGFINIFKAMAAG